MTCHQDGVSHYSPKQAWPVPSFRRQMLLLAIACSLCLSVGCGSGHSRPAPDAAKQATSSAPENIRSSTGADTHSGAPAEVLPFPELLQQASRKEIGPNVFFVKSGERRWVEIQAEVCLQKGYIEHLLTRTAAGKGYESVLQADIDARHVHAALLAAGASPGRPAQFFNDRGEPEFQPPTGQRILVLVRYQKAGQTIVEPARSWVRNAETKKELDRDWVFAGSRFYPNPEGGEPYYGANEGRVICTANFANALLDLPFKSQEGDPQAGLDFEVNTHRVPPIGTPVTLILIPLDEKNRGQ